MKLPSTRLRGPRSATAALRLRQLGLASLCAGLSLAALAQPEATAAPDVPATPDVQASADAPAPVLAADGASLRFNGFGTLGVVNVSPHDRWGFRRELTEAAHHDTHPRVDVDSRVGLQANWRLDSDWELVGQVVLKPRANESTAEESLAWAFAAWRPDADWTVRIGRTSPDLFLLADVRNVGFAYPWIRPSVEFYGWMPPSTLDGIDVTREWRFGDSRWRAKLFGGRSNVTLAANDDDGDSHAVVDPLLGGAFTYDSGPLTLKATFAQARTTARNHDSIAQLHTALGVIASLPVPVVADQAAILRDSFTGGLLITRYSALSASWDASPWQLQAELSRITGNFTASQAWYGYASAAYRMGNTTVFSMVGRARASRAPLPQPNWTASLAPLVGPVAAAQAQYAGADIAASFNAERENQGSVSVGARWDVNDQVDLKLQLDAVRSAAYGGGMWAFDTYAAHRAFVLSAGLDFVF